MKKKVGNHEIEIFFHLRAVLKQQNIELLEIQFDYESENGHVYDIVFRCDGKVISSSIIHHSSLITGNNWVWQKDFDNFKTEIREIDFLIRQFIALPKEEKMQKMDYFLEELTNRREYYLPVISRMLAAYQAMYD
ncbi:MAG: hypothetical protein ACLFQP_00520 [Halothece sp.]